MNSTVNNDLQFRYLYFHSNSEIIYKFENAFAKYRVKNFERNEAKTRIKSVVFKIIKNAQKYDQKHEKQLFLFFSSWIEEKKKNLKTKRNEKLYSSTRIFDANGFKLNVCLQFLISIQIQVISVDFLHFYANSSDSK